MAPHKKKPGASFICVVTIINKTVMKNQKMNRIGFELSCGKNCNFNVKNTIIIAKTNQSI
jgi:hypothetical protein